jgi:signal transduction histidine kinase
VGAVLLACLAAYSWRRRDVPAVKPFVAISAFSSLMLFAIAAEAAAVLPATKVFWHQLEYFFQLLAVTGGTCFTLEYVYPGRWLTRGTLALLALPPALVLLMMLLNGTHVVWRDLEVGPAGSIVPTYALPGALLLAYGWCLVFLNAAAFAWLFVRSPQHRAPVALMLGGQILGRAFYLAELAEGPALLSVDANVLAVIAPLTAYAIALFGFRIFDPLPAARATAIAQMPEGIAVFDSQWRVAHLNPSAARLLSIQSARANGKELRELLPEHPELVARLMAAKESAFEISLGFGAETRCFALVLTALKDFRGLEVGHLVAVRDVTEQRRAQTTLIQQQRALAVLHERERVARELHDGLGQVIASAHLQATAAKRLLARGEAEQVNECLSNIADSTLQAEADVRDYLLGAKSVVTPERPFFATLREYLAIFSRRYGLAVDLAVPSVLEDQGLEQGVELQVLRIIQEALTNVRKHARATAAHVVFAPEGQQVRITVIDNGQGFQPDRGDGFDGYGLQAMRERAAGVGGSLTVVSALGSGTQVIARVPRDGL